jgi:rootletin
MKNQASNNVNSGSNAGVGVGDSNSGDYDDGGSSNTENRILTQQIIELRRRLDDDHSSYNRKLQHYQESQQKQAQLVSKLQQKVLQYKTKCNELELSLESKNCEMERIKSQYALQNKSVEDENSCYDTETLLLRIEEEQQK